MAVRLTNGLKKKFEFDRINFTFNEDGPLFIYTSLRKYNRTHLGLTANCTIKDVIDERYRFTVEMQVWRDGGWKRNFITHESNNPCVFMNYVLGSMWRNIVTAIGHPDTCPYQKAVRNNGLKRKFEFERLTSTFNEDGPLSVYTSLRKYNRTHMELTANCTLRDVIDKRYRFTVEVQVWRDGGWKRNFLTHENNNPCVVMSLALGPMWRNIVKAAGHPDTCPYQKGFYHIEDYYVDVSDLPLLISLGRCKVLANVYLGDIWISETSKKRRFHPFRNLRKIFRRGGGDKVRTSGSEEAVPVSDVTPSEPESQGHRSRSTSELLAGEEPRKKSAPGGGLGSGALSGGALSVSHDSVFTAEQRSTSSDLDTAQSSSSLSIQQLMQQTGVRAELIDVVRRRGRGRGDTSEDEEDLGLPRSPCNSPTTTDKALKEHPTKSHSTCSDGSLLSMGSSEMDEDSFGHNSRHSSKLSLHDRRPSQAPTAAADSELELGGSTNAAPLSHSAARHKMSVRPKRTHGAPRRRRVQQLTAGSALPTTPEVNEEVSTRSLTPEGTANRETIAELYSSSSTSMNKVWSTSTSGSCASETQLKSASLPPGLALGSGTSKLSRSRSNAGSRGARDAFLEEDESDDKLTKDDKKKEESFFGRFLARRSGKKKKSKSEDADSQITTTSSYKTSEETIVTSYKTTEDKRTYSVDSGIPKIARSGPASRQRIQPIDIPASPDAFRHNKRQQHFDLELPMPPVNSSPNESSFLESSPTKKMLAFLPPLTKITPSPEKPATTEPFPEAPIPSPRTILPHSTKTTPTSPEIIPTIRTILPQSYSPPKSSPSEVYPAPRNIFPQSVSPPKPTWPETQSIKTSSQSEVKISEFNSKVEECKTKVKITGLSSYQQRVMSYNDEFDSAAFKSLDETSEDNSISSVALTKSQSFRSKSVLSSTQDHSSLPFSVNSCIYDTNSDSEIFTDSLMSSATIQPSNPLPQVSVTIKKSTENISKETENEVKIINTNAETVDKYKSKEKINDVKIKDFIEKKIDSIDSVTVSNDEINSSEKKFEKQDDGITISCVNSQVQASVNTKSSNQVIVSISNPSESVISNSEQTETISTTVSSETSMRESISQVSVTKVQLKRDSIKSPDTPTVRVPEFLKIQLNKVDAKSPTNVVLSTSNSFSKADEKPKQKSVLEIETDRESGEIITDAIKRKFSTDDVEIVDKDISEEIVEIPSKNFTVTNLKPALPKNENSKPTLIINSQPRKSSLVSTSPVSPTTNKSFLKKKSNSLELGDSVKLEEKPGNSNKPLANSADQLSCSMTETFKEKTASSGDISDTTDVVMRKKSLGSQKRNKDSDEPELMKVFARRSLKLKDSEAETLSQQVLILVESENQNKESAENNKRDSDKENEGNESPVEERKKSIHLSKDVPKPKDPLTESKFVETADVTLRKPSTVINNKLSVFGGSKYQRTVSLSAPAQNNEEETEKRRNKSFIEPKNEKKSVNTNFRSPHIMNIREKDIEIKKSNEIKTKTGDELITSSLKKDFENEDYVPRFKRIQQRKEEWEQRAQQNMKKSVP